MNARYARDCSKKIRAVIKAKGQSGKPLANRIPYGYKRSESDKNVWEIDEEAAENVRKMFRWCIDGKGTQQISNMLEQEKVLTPTAYHQKKTSGAVTADKPYRWTNGTISRILERPEYIGHTVNFKTITQSYKHKKKSKRPREEWQIFENTYEPIISQHDFDLVQGIRDKRHRIQKIGEVSLFSGMAYCADCGSRMHLCRKRTENRISERMTCGRYMHDKTECTAHYIRTVVLREIIIGELNKLLDTINCDEERFVEQAMNAAKDAHTKEVTKAKKLLAKSEKRIVEIDKLSVKLYEDNATGKVTDERYAQISANYDSEQKQLKQTVSELSVFIDESEQKKSDITKFTKLIGKYTHIDELTPEIMHELIEKIIIHEGDRSSGHRRQKVEIYFRFNIASCEAVIDSREDIAKARRLRAERKHSLLD